MNSGQAERPLPRAPARRARSRSRSSAAWAVTTWPIAQARAGKSGGGVAADVVAPVVGHVGQVGGELEIEPRVARRDQVVVHVPRRAGRRGPARRRGSPRRPAPGGPGRPSGSSRTGPCLRGLAAQSLAVCFAIQRPAGPWHDSHPTPSLSSDGQRRRVGRGGRGRVAGQAACVLFGRGPGARQVGGDRPRPLAGQHLVGVGVPVAGDPGRVLVAEDLARPRLASPPWQAVAEHDPAPRTAGVRVGRSPPVPGAGPSPPRTERPPPRARRVRRSDRTHSFPQIRREAGWESTAADAPP